MKIVAEFLSSLLATVLTFLTRPAAPTAPVVTNGKADVAATLTKYILSQTESLYMPTTGGRIHPVTPATAATVASLIIASAKKYDLKVSLLASYIRGESCFDPLAVNPNNQLSGPSETPAQAFAHTDFGIGQIDGATLLAMPQFAGETLEAISARAYDPDWAISQMCEIIVANRNEFATIFAASPGLPDVIPGDTDAQAVAIAEANAYNAGVRGTVKSLHSPSPNLAYGIGVMKRAAALSPLLDVA